MNISKPKGESITHNYEDPLEIQEIKPYESEEDPILMHIVHPVVDNIEKHLQKSTNLVTNQEIWPF